MLMTRLPSSTCALPYRAGLQTLSCCAHLLRAPRLQVHWYLASDALPKLPSWAASGKTWAPEVTAVPGGETACRSYAYLAKDMPRDKFLPCYCADR